jgi:pimeloyl-ACP methyl ester carboxylesterase
MSSSVTLVCIRGLLREARHWGAFTTLLQRELPSAQISTPDISGNGRLNHLISPDKIAGMTEALRGQVASRRNLTLIAISMGGMIAIDWFTRYPDEVKSAVLINTSVRRLSPFYYRLRPSAGLRFIKNAVSFNGAA